MNENKYPVLSVLIPCRNEEKYITKVLDNVLAQDYPREKLELFIIDGESTDNTVSLVKDYASRYSFIHLLNNPFHYVPQALNMAIHASHGEVILRMDAHSFYPNNYMSRLVEALMNSDAENTGGMWITEAGNDSPEALAISRATSHPFGIGNALYRLGADSPRYVDTVPYGCYKRAVFDRIGTFDEQLVRNQDDEFNARLIANGGKILLLPDLKIRYFARENIKKMSTMFYQYGYYKPLVNLKLGRPASVRQLFPPLLTGGLISLILLSLFHIYFLYLFVLALVVYFIPVLYFSYKLSGPEKIFSYLVRIFPAIHFSYGWGYLKGIFDFVILSRHKRSKK